MVVLHAFMALVGGFATMALLVIVMTALLQKLTPAWLAHANPLIHVLALAITVLLLAALSALQQRGQQPVWYILSLVALTPIGVLAGGLIRLRVLGIL